LLRPKAGPEHGSGKLIPPGEVLEAELAGRIEAKTRAAVTERILRDAGLEDQVAAAIGKITTPAGTALAKGIKQLFQREPPRSVRAVHCGAD
jgi:hypothetical protein